MNLRDLFLRVRALVARRRMERELDDELAFHIERETQRQIADDRSPQDARMRALARFGSVPLAADQCRDARGNAFIDDLARDLFTALRSFRRAPLAALTIVATVGLGLGLVTVVFTVYNTIFLRTDAVLSPGELFAMERPVRPGADAWLPFTRQEYEAIRRDNSVFADVVAMVRPVRARLDGRPVSVALVSGNFFQVLGVQAARGRALMPGDDERSASLRVIVLSHRGWNRLFAGDPGAIGRRALVNGVPYEVVGVMPDGFRGVQVLPPDYWVPLGLAGQFRAAAPGTEDEIAVEVVGRLKPGMSPEAATSGLTGWASTRADARTAALPLLSIRLSPRQGTLSAGAFRGLMIFSPIFFAFGLILMIGCANVANLLLARGVSRQRELGIRLSLGASRRRVIRQLLTESLLLALAAAACGLAVSRAFLNGALHAVTASAPRELLDVDVASFVPAADWRVVAFMVAGAIVSTVLFGLVPALQATRLELVRTMRGEVTTDARPSRARHGLILIQVAASALLLICAGVFLRSALAAAADPGVRISDTVTVAVANEPRRLALLQAVTAHPSVLAVAASSPRTLAVAEVSTPDEATADTPAIRSRQATVEQIAASPGYFDLIGIAITSGRGFTPAERTADAGVAMVSETIARLLWPDRRAVGQVVRMRAAGGPDTAPTPARVFTVVGVVRDVSGPLAPDMFPSHGVYVPASVDLPGTSLTLRVRGDPDQARQALLESLTLVDPGLGAITTMRAAAGMQAYVLRVAFWVAMVLGGLALLLTVSGLFSVLSYIVEQRAKDIGVRMALGATTGRVAGLVLSQSLVPVGIGLVAGAGLAAALAIVLTTVSAEMGGLVHVFDPVAYAAGVLVIVIACLLATSLPVWRAARIDPVATLKNE